MNFDMIIFDSLYTSFKTKEGNLLTDVPWMSSKVQQHFPPLPLFFFLTSGRLFMGESPRAYFQTKYKS